MNEDFCYGLILGMVCLGLVLWIATHVVESACQNVNDVADCKMDISWVAVSKEEKD